MCMYYIHADVNIPTMNTYMCVCKDIPIISPETTSCCKTLRTTTMMPGSRVLSAVLNGMISWVYVSMCT